MKKWYILLFASMISVGHVIFVWRFWTYGIDAVGVNMMFLWFLILGFFLYVHWHNISSMALLWIVPIVLIISSIGIYSTFTTWISIIFLPLFFFIFTTHDVHGALRGNLWSKFFPLTMVYASFRFVQSIFIALGQYTRNTKKQEHHRHHAIVQIIMGMIILSVLAGVIVIPLLSSADASFARMFDQLFDFLVYIFTYFSLPVLVRGLYAIFFTVILVGYAHYIRRDLVQVFSTGEDDALKKNAIMIGTIMIGILIIYLLFIGIQVRALFVSVLPVDFSQTESFVKTGFWQLFFLTILNIIFYVGVYKKSTNVVQGILALFTGASLLLIVSAAQRVFLYVTTYGLSYEKFFALYTVIYCTIVFVWFLALFTMRYIKVHILQTLSFLALWMYAMATVLPLDRMIISTNLDLTQNKNSRVNINELTMLNGDAVAFVEDHYVEVIAAAHQDAEKRYFMQNDVNKRKNIIQDPYERRDVDEEWLRWIKREQDQKTMLFTHYNSYDSGKHEGIEKKWYEKTISEWTYQPHINVGMMQKNLER